MATRTYPNPLTPTADDVSPGLKAALEHAAALERVKAWPCHGVCSTLLWPEGVTVCSSGNSEIDGLCTRHFGHDGPHIECTADRHAVRVWARKAA